MPKKGCIKLNHQMPKWECLEVDRIVFWKNWNWSWLGCVFVGISSYFSTVEKCAWSALICTIKDDKLHLKGHSGSETQLDLEHRTILIQTIHGTNGILTDPWIVDFYGKWEGVYIYIYISLVPWMRRWVMWSCHVPIESCFGLVGGSGGSKGQGKT